MRVVLAGATGLIGTHVLDQLLARPDGPAVLVLTRRPTGRSHPRLTEKVAEIAAWPGLIATDKADALLVTLGTTIRKAGSKTAFAAIDHDAVLALAKAAVQAGVRHMLVVSSVGARSSSGNFYLHTKGRMEDALRVLGFARLDIFRPGLLRGPRQEFRPGERLGQIAQLLLDPLLMGSLRKFRSISGAKVANALVRTLNASATGQFVHHYDSIMQAAAD